MAKSKQSVGWWGFLLVLLLLGCETRDSVNGNSFHEDRSARFCTANNLSNSLLKQFVIAADQQNSDSIEYPYCIYTEDISRNTQTENNVENWAEVAMNTWIEPLIGQSGWPVRQAAAYRVQRTGSGCPSKHNGLRVYSIRINDMDGANNSYPGFHMNMGGWGVHKLVVLHEMGHAIGLGDTYNYDNLHPIGQPSATMKNQWVLGGVLQQDDIDAVRFLWARIRGENNPCPDGYIIGSTEEHGKNTPGSVYCVLGEDPNPNCKDNSSFVDAQGYSCSDWIGYDCSLAEEGYGYTAAQEKDIKSNCKKSCDLCNSEDNCPDDPNKTEPGVCGCGTPDTDGDNDGTPNCNDECPNDRQKTEPGECGCGRPEGTCNDSCEDNSDFIDAQGYLCEDWVGYDCSNAGIWGYSNVEEQEIKSNCPKSCDICPDDNDKCPSDPNKTEPGICGCGTPDTDSDGDGTANCKDNCPNDPQKTTPGECGCGTPEGTCDDSCEDNGDFIDAQGYTCDDWVGYDCTNAENWGYSNAEEQEIKENCPKSCDLCPDDNDKCPDDPNKTEPGVCGCGTPDTDSDGDGTANCRDNCPNDRQKTEPGECGCGKPEGSCDDSCEDTPGFVDAQGFSCDDWVGYDCTSAEDYGYSDAEEQEIRASCKQSCGLCDDEPPDGTGLRFVVYGDSRTNPDQHKQIVSGIASFNPELVLHSGDIWDGYSSSEWRSHITRHANLNNLLQKNLYLVARGNHESVSEVVNFSPSIVRNNSVVYSLSKGNVFFVSLSMDPSSARSYLSNALKSSAAQNATWRVVFSHYPIYSAGSHGEDGVSAVESICDQYGVDLFFSGHDHHYERSHQIKNDSIVDTGDNLVAGRGTVYTVTGGGGAPLYSVGGEWWTNTANSTRHYIGIVSTENKLTVKVIKNTGSTLDSFTISQ